MHYDSYRLSFKGWILSIFAWSAVSAIFAYFFFRSVVCFFVFFLFFPIFVKVVRQKCMAGRKWNLKSQFADALLGISTALAAGNSMENAFRKAYYEMKAMHGEESDIAKELHAIVKGMDNNLTVESMLLDFANRSHVEEIEDFADIFSVGKRSGGNMKDIMGVCCNTISESVELQREFRILLSSRRFEMQIMSVVPFGIILYIGSASAGYFDSLYHVFPGTLIMAGCMLLYVTAFLWGEKVIEKTQNF